MFYFFDGFEVVAPDDLVQIVADQEGLVIFHEGFAVLGGAGLDVFNHDFLLFGVGVRFHLRALSVGRICRHLHPINML